MDAHFTRHEAGQVDVDRGPDWSLFSEALNDSVSSLPPRGVKGNGPSIYWVDVAILGLNRALASGSDRPFAWGNITLFAAESGDESKPATLPETYRRNLYPDGPV